jgi:hypothetical protein
MGVGGWDVFVSYGHQDAAWVRVLAENLHRPASRFLDEWELVAGDRVTWRLEEGIRRSVSGVLVVSPHSLSRPWVREEYEALLRQAVQDPGRRLIPVLYADSDMAVFLANRLWVDFRGPGRPARAMRSGWKSWCGRCGAAPSRTGPGPGRRGGVAGGCGRGARAAGGPLQAVLSVSADRVSLLAGPERVSGPAGLRASTAAAGELVWRQSHPDPGTEPGEGDARLRKKAARR